MNNIGKKEKRNKKPLISIITVVLNGEMHISQTIESVIAQKRADIEFIVIDGGSTDKTIDIIRKYERNIDVFVSEPDQGIYDAMNKGLQLSSGEWVWFLNSDDYLEENVISNIYSQNENLNLDKFDVIYGNLRKIGKKYNYVVKKRNLLQWKKIISYSHPATLVKSNLLKKMNGFNKDYRINADYDLFLRLAKMNPETLYINQVFTNMRHGGASEKLIYSIRRIRERFHIDKINLGGFYALKNLILYTSPGLIKKMFRIILEKLGFSSLIDKYFKNKYKAS